MTRLVAGASTNAVGWRFSHVDVVHAEPFDFSTCSASFEALLCYGGVHRDDLVFLGSKIKAELRGTIAFEDGLWTIRDFEIRKARVVD